MAKSYFDEDSTRHSLIAALRSRSLDVTTSLEAGMNACADEAQLTFAASCDRVLVTANVGDFSILHSGWLQTGRTHAGILVIQQQRDSTGEMVRRILRFHSSGPDLRNRLYFLSNF